MWGNWKKIMVTDFSISYFCTFQQRPSFPIQHFQVDEQSSFKLELRIRLNISRIRIQPGLMKTMKSGSKSNLNLIKNYRLSDIRTLLNRSHFLKENGSGTSASTLKHFQVFDIPFTLSGEYYFKKISAVFTVLISIIRKECCGSIIRKSGHV